MSGKGGRERSATCSQEGSLLHYTGHPLKGHVSLSNLRLIDEANRLTKNVPQISTIFRQDNRSHNIVCKTLPRKLRSSIASHEATETTHEATVPLSYHPSSKYPQDEICTNYPAEQRRMYPTSQRIVDSQSCSYSPVNKNGMTMISGPQFVNNLKPEYSFKNSKVPPGNLIGLRDGKNAAIFCSQQEPLGSLADEGGNRLEEFCRPPPMFCNSPESPNSSSSKSSDKITLENSSAISEEQEIIQMNYAKNESKNSFIREKLS